MDNRFFEQPILNSPYEYPMQHWELDGQGQPTQRIIEKRRSAKFITPIPKPRKRKNKDVTKQQEFVFDEGKGISTKEQQYDPTPIINALRCDVDKWRTLKNPNDWKVTPETARLIQHWRHHKFNDIRPFFLSGSGYVEGTLFPWTMSDFSLMDAIECGIVKLPRVPVADNIPGEEMPKFRNLWQHIGKKMPKKGRGKSKTLDPLSLPVELQTALEALYGHYKKTYDLFNWVILDSDWEAEFCRVAESHPKVKAYIKNHNLGLEVPYRYGSEMRTYLPDFIVLIDDGHDNLLNLIVEIKGYRREDAKEKKSTMETYWVPGVNNHGHYGRWAFAEFTEVYQIEADFEAKVEEEFNKMIEEVIKGDE